MWLGLSQCHSALIPLVGDLPLPVTREWLGAALEPGEGVIAAAIAGVGSPNSSSTYWWSAWDRVWRSHRLGCRCWPEPSASGRCGAAPSPPSTRPPVAKRLTMSLTGSISPSARPRPPQGTHGLTEVDLTEDAPMVATAVNPNPDRRRPERRCCRRAGVHGPHGLRCRAPDADARGNVARLALRSPDPNAETVEAMREARRGNLQSFDTVEDL